MDTIPDSNTPVLKFADKAIKFFQSLEAPEDIDENIEFLNPYKNEEVRKITSSFYNKYFNDNKKRIFVLGINPGRYGGGITGISFTDPAALENFCGIKNNFDKKRELSSNFIYNFILHYGGLEKFYSKYFLSALFPLALLKDGLNYNYYDDKNFYTALRPAIIKSILNQTEFGAQKDYVICLGRKNAKYLNEINKEYRFFNEIIVLDHPRYIMQYKLKLLDKYLNNYLEVFTK
jgi:hypothetical protein